MLQTQLEPLVVEEVALMEAEDAAEAQIVAEELVEEGVELLSHIPMVRALRPQRAFHLQESQAPGTHQRQYHLKSPRRMMMRLLGRLLKIPQTVRIQQLRLPSQPPQLQQRLHQALFQMA